ncbi:MAG TPA: GatB/YqeY domain-containing protein [Gemmatimonadaceae bacterium]|nr:GatB/YqeY domain-containing protein [Gemmatimonadaceae bacterium]
MSQLLDRLHGDMTAARKAQDKAQVLLLGTIIADVRNREIELNREVSDDDVIEVLRRGIKKRRESIEMYDKGGRADLAGVERAEAEMLGGYLPASVGDEEIRKAVTAAIDGGAANVGAVMGKVMGQFKGRADGATINAIVREELAKRA